MAGGTVFRSRLVRSTEMEIQAVWTFVVMGTKCWVAGIEDLSKVALIHLFELTLSSRTSFLRFVMPKNLPI